MLQEDKMITSDELTENLSPFELSLFLEKKLHEENHNLETLLKAGRGNPNWTAPTPRERTNGWYDSAKFW